MVCFLSAWRRVVIDASRRPEFGICVHAQLGEIVRAEGGKGRRFPEHDEAHRALECTALVNARRRQRQ